jgi:hypothetical protein
VADAYAFILYLIQVLPDDAEPVFQGSSVAGESYKQKTENREFDSGRVSDYDVAIVSETLWASAVRCNIKCKGGRHTVPLDEVALKALDLTGTKMALELVTEKYCTQKREVNFMIYASRDAVSKHTGPSLLCIPTEGREDFQTAMWGNIPFGIHKKT